MPESARRDMIEWPFEPTAELEFSSVLQRETSVAKIVADDPNTQAMHDDRPVNEYVILRKLNASRFQLDALVAWYEHTKNL